MFLKRYQNRLTTCLNFVYKMFAYNAFPKYFADSGNISLNSKKVFVTPGRWSHVAKYCYKEIF